VVARESHGVQGMTQRRTRDTMMARLETAIRRELLRQDGAVDYRDVDALTAALILAVHKAMPAAEQRAWLGNACRRTPLTRLCGRTVEGK